MASSSGRFRLVVRKGPQPGKVYDLTQMVHLVGRDASSDIIVADVEVSRQHARLSATESGFQIEDLASTNGVFVNGERVTGARALSPGDVIGVGQTVELAFEMAEAPQPAAPPPAPEPAPANFGLPSMGSTPAAPPPTPAYSAPRPAAAPPPPPPPPNAPASGGRPAWLWWAVGGGVVLLLCCCLSVIAALSLGLVPTGG
jgi:predicted component of type VI protein secretion system